MEERSTTKTGKTTYTDSHKYPLNASHIRREGEWRMNPFSPPFILPCVIHCEEKVYRVSTILKLRWINI